MRILLSALAALALLATAPAVWADDDDPSAFEEYLMRTGRNAKAGMNGILTFPADPVAFSAEGAEIFESNVGGRFLGLGAGVLQGIYRVAMGASDLALAMVPTMPVLSPIPRYKMLPYDHPEEY